MIVFGCIRCCLLTSMMLHDSAYLYFWVNCGRQKVLQFRVWVWVVEQMRVTWKLVGMKCVEVEELIEEVVGFLSGNTGFKSREGWITSVWLLTLGWNCGVPLEKLPSLCDSGHLYSLGTLQSVSFFINLWQWEAQSISMNSMGSFKENSVFRLLSNYIMFVSI